jgi:methionyl-tRNA formyltransferase
MAEESVMKKRVVFMGTPDFAAVILKDLLEWGGCDIIGVYTQPDRPGGRGHKLRQSPVKETALEWSLPVYQPVNFKDKSDIETLRSLEPDYLVVAAYGLILPQDVLDCAKIMPINVHASLLPKYRGAAPIQRAIENGEAATGITIMKMEAGLDTGPMLLQHALGIAWDDYAGKIHDELAAMGGPMVIETMQRYDDGTMSVFKQDDDLATYAAKLSKEDGLIDWNRPAGKVHDQIRAMHPWPGAYFFWNNEDGNDELRLNIYPGRVSDESAEGIKPGTLLEQPGGILGIACADKIYLVDKIKPAGKKAMDSQGFLCGYLGRCCIIEHKD